ncbi:MAG: hypothetical protein AMJ37_01220, partial [Dehalococcoidia bacterium DG_18]
IEQAPQYSPQGAASFSKCFRSGLVIENSFLEIFELHRFTRGTEPSWEEVKTLDLRDLTAIETLLLKVQIGNSIRNYWLTPFWLTVKMLHVDLKMAGRNVQYPSTGASTRPFNPQLCIPCIIVL